MSEEINQPKTESVVPVSSSECVVPPADTRARIITATITLRVGSIRPEKIAKVAQRRKAELIAWIERHWRDLENDVPSFMDELSWDIEMTAENPED